jgi:hypothetical protein
MSTQNYRTTKLAGLGTAATMSIIGIGGVTATVDMLTSTQSTANLPVRVVIGPY